MLLLLKVSVQIKLGVKKSDLVIGASLRKTQKSTTLCSELCSHSDIVSNKSVKMLSHKVLIMFMKEE